jgi:hypothetical protein
MENIKTRVTRLEQQLADQASSPVAPQRTPEMDAAFLKKIQAVLDRPLPEMTQEELIAKVKADITKMQASSRGAAEMLANAARTNPQAT